MTYSYPASRVDLNQPAIVSALKSAGCCVVSLAPIGKGCPDLLVGRAGRTHLIEVKSGKRPKDNPRRDLTVHQVEFLSDWNGHAVHICYDAEEALSVVFPTSTDIRRPIDGLNATMKVSP